MNNNNIHITRLELLEQLILDQRPEDCYRYRIREKW